MLNPAIKPEIHLYAKAFAENDPFRHVVIEDFFRPDVADKLIEQFPVFEAENALNEMGKPGGKAVVEDLQSISPFYAQVGDYLASREFLAAMSAITGVPGLQYDRQMFGGGTHENRHGQELDPHVDFNMLHGWHRRLNLIVYLNREWDASWGGSIELHSDPRNPEQNRITSFAPVFNRAIIFETNEHSWHGFPRIDLPEGMRELSRKSLSIYLYTRDRPESEKAPPHGTFYVPRPLPAHLVPGYTLTAEDVAQIRNLTTRRDHMIAFLQQQELENSAKYQSLIRPLARLRNVPLLGPVAQRAWHIWRGSSKPRA